MTEISPYTPAARDFSTNWFTFSPASLFLLLNIVIGTIFISSRFTPKRKPNDEEEEEGEERHHRQRLVRAPSLIDRVKSINFSFHRNSPSPDFPHYGNTTGVDRQRPRETEAKHAGEREPEADRSSGEASSRYSSPSVTQRALPLLQRLKSVKLSSFYRSESVAGEPESEEEGELGYAEEAENRDHHDDHQVTRSKSEQRTTAERKGAERMRRWASEKAMAVEEEDEERERVERRRPETTRVEKTASFGDDEGVDAKADDFITKFKQQLKLQRLDSLLRYRDMFK